MNEQLPTAINELSQEIVLLHTATISRLLKCKDKNLRTSALALYTFYAWVCSWQHESQIKANDAFCMKGLGWGKQRFYQAKQSLLKTGLIEQLVRKDIHNKITGSYVYVRYAKSSVLENHRPAQPETGPQNASAIDKKISAHINTSTNVEGRVSKKTSSCPLLNKNFQLIVKYPNGHTECVEYLTSEEEDRGAKFINRSKQFSMIHKILRAGYDFTAMDKTIRQVEKKYGKGGWDYATLASWLEKGSSNA